MCCALLVACTSSLALAPAMLALAPAQTKNTLRFEQMCQRFASHPASTLARVDVASVLLKLDDREASVRDAALSAPVSYTHLTLPTKA